ncbi:MAG TPA: adenosylhomocysteinase [Streptosporangiaceae bacterium]|nr:adenosylhomocysteinase [Streptosporangiaceae bacterium]
MSAGGGSQQGGSGGEFGSDIADPGLAGGGLARIAWAERAMPVLGLLREECASKQPFAGRSIAACLHVTAETAVLVGVLSAGGGRVHLAASNPLSTQDDIAAALASQPDVFVNAKTGVDRETYYAHLHRALDGAPDLVVDDGGDLVNTLHADRPELLPGVAGGCESTSTGVMRLRRMAAEGTLAFPVVAADASVTRRMFDNGYGTSQSVIDGLMRATNILLAGKTVVVAGFGSSGSAIAQRAAGLGAQVIVTEVDPVRALDAIMSGYRVLPMTQAAPVGDLFITATGSRDVIAGEHLELMKDGAVLANAGHFDVEIDVRALADLAIDVNRGIRPNADEYVLESGRRLILLADGRVVNLIAAEGNPAAVMDLSFAAQVIALMWLISGEAGLTAGVHPIPAAIDAEVARLTLAAHGTTIDELTPSQQEYLESWRQGS